MGAVGATTSPTGFSPAGPIPAAILDESQPPELALKRLADSAESRACSVTRMVSRR